MSHEIRTPLNGILGTINLLSQEEPRADQLDYLQTLEFSGSHLLSLVNDILDFSKIEANRIQFENIDFSIRNIVNTLLKIFAYKCADKGVELIAEIDPSVPEYVQGDSVRLNQILTNLIGNAVKFTEKGSIRVKVSTIGNRPDSLTCLFEVIDTGIGIPFDKQEEIFDLFSQADSDTTRRFGGTGLGLAITRKLIEFQGGKISVDSEPEKGSRFYYQLDFGISHTSHDLDKSSANCLQPLTGVKVLLVEDNKINQMIATKFLNRWEAVVDIAENGQEALEKIRRMDYHIVLMDLQMPVMDGYQASREIRSLEGEYFQHIPIIALTASTFNEVRENLIKFGLDDIINKPFIPEDLNNKIHGYLNSGRL